jgi:hypothetical protein
LLRPTVVSGYDRYYDTRYVYATYTNCSSLLSLQSRHSKNRLCPSTKRCGKCSCAAFLPQPRLSNVRVVAPASMAGRLPPYPRQQQHIKHPLTCRESIPQQTPFYYFRTSIKQARHQHGSQPTSRRNGANYWIYVQQSPARRRIALPWRLSHSLRWRLDRSPAQRASRHYGRQSVRYAAHPQVVYNSEQLR